MSISASDINVGGTGFDPNFADKINVAADPNARAQGGIFKGIGDAVSGLASLFTNGVEIFKSVSGQFAAAKAIAKETYNPNPQVVIVPGSPSLLSSNNLIKIGVVVAVGALALILIRKPSTR
jgi:hypothetical protein